MSNHLAIAAVSATLRRTLQEFVQADVASATVTALRPDASGLPDPGVNIFLYQVTPNPAWRNSDLPTRDSRGQVVQRPRVALDLHYLLSFYGADVNLEPQRVLGSAARALRARPYLTRESIEDMLSDPLFAFLAGSDLADEVELVKFTPQPFNLEELSKLWSVLLQTPYALSIAYMATVVLIEADVAPRRPLPVRERNISVFPFQRASIDRVVSTDGPRAPIEMGSTMVIEGSQLAGAIDRVRVGVADLQPAANSVTPSELRVELTVPELRAGVQGVQVVYESGAESNVAALVLRPLITVGAVTASTVTIAFNPAVDRAQRVVLYLNEMNAPSSREPRAYSFEAPADNGILNPAVDETATITFSISNVEPATYLVRVQVNGAENVLETDTIEASPTFDFYIGPTAVIP